MCFTTLQICAVPERCDARRNSGDQKPVLGEKLETKDVASVTTSKNLYKVVLGTLYIFYF